MGSELNALHESITIPICSWCHFVSCGQSVITLIVIEGLVSFFLFKSRIGKITTTSFGAGVGVGISWMDCRYTWEGRKYGTLASAKANWLHPTPTPPSLHASPVTLKEQEKAGLKPSDHSLHVATDSGYTNVKG